MGHSYETFETSFWGLDDYYETPQTTNSVTIIREIIIVKEQNEKAVSPIVFI